MTSSDSDSTPTGTCTASGTTPPSSARSSGPDPADQLGTGPGPVTPRTVHTDDAPAAVGAYSQAVRAGDLVFVSGQLPLDPATGELAGPGVRDEAVQSLRNAAAVLAAAGSGVDRVVKTTVLLTDIDDFAVVNEAYAEVFSGGVLPARAAYAVAALPRGARVEIELVAVAS